MAEGNDFALGYAMGQDSGGNSNGGDFGFGGGGWGGLLGLIVVASLFGWGGMGGGFGGMGGGAGLQGMATRADINEGFALNNITSGITAIQQGICDSTYALNNAITGIGHQISDCCCQTGRAIDGVNYNIASQFAALNNNLCGIARDITDNQNANTRSILDFLVNDKISTLTAENQSLKFAASQAQQNNYIAATIDAATAELLRRTGHDCPSAAYIVQPPTPVSFPVNSCGQAQFGGNGCGGCGF